MKLDRVEIEKKAVAIFDFDETLVRQESLAMFLRILAGDGKSYVSACCSASMRAIMTEPRNRHNLFRKDLIRRIASGKTVTQAVEAAQCVFYKLDWISAVTTKLFLHYELGRRILIATGSLSIYIPVLLSLKGIYINGLLSTEMEVNNGVLTGEITTPFCTWSEKAKRVEKWLSSTEVSPSIVWGYGNLPSDEAMLSLAHYPTVVRI